MNIEHFVVRARQFDNNEPNKTSANKLALDFAAHVNFMTTTDYARVRAVEHAEAALRIVTLLGIRLGLEDDDIELALHTPGTTLYSHMFEAGFASVSAAIESISDERMKLRSWLFAVCSFKTLLTILNIDFDKTLTDFILV